MEIVIAQSAKRTGRVCGDYVIVDRTQEATTTIVADGIGTGIKARVAAVMCASLQPTFRNSILSLWVSKW